MIHNHLNVCERCLNSTDTYLRTVTTAFLQACETKPHEILKLVNKPITNCGRVDLKPILQLPGIKDNLLKSKESLHDYIAPKKRILLRLKQEKYVKMCIGCSGIYDLIKILLHPKLINPFIFKKQTILPLLCSLGGFLFKIRYVSFIFFSKFANKKRVFEFL